MSKKDINTLIKLSRKLGESICDQGTYEERQSKHLIMKWKYKGNTFVHTFPGSSKTSPINYQYSQMRKNLRATGLKPPRLHAFILAERVFFMNPFKFTPFLSAYRCH